MQTNARPITRGIYAIYSAVNDTIYIGYSGNILRRWEQHRSDLRGGRRGNKHLQRAWKKYGKEAFEWIILEECAVELLHIREQYHLDQYPKHYNHGPCAASPRRGVPHTDEAKVKMMGNQNAIGTVHTLETRERMSGSHMGHVHSPETRKRIGDASRGRKRSPETLERMSAAQKAAWARRRTEKADL